MKIAGFDIGTTGCKCTVFDEQGRYLNKAYRDYPVQRAVLKSTSPSIMCGLRLLSMPMNWMALWSGKADFSGLAFLFVLFS